MMSMRFSCNGSSRDATRASCVRTPRDRNDLRCRQVWSPYSVLKMRAKTRTSLRPCPAFFATASLRALSGRAMYLRSPRRGALILEVERCLSNSLCCTSTCGETVSLDSSTPTFGVFIYRTARTGRQWLNQLNIVYTALTSTELLNKHC